MNHSHSTSTGISKMSLALHLLCLTLIIGGYFLISARQQRVGYVNSLELVNGYMGMKEARNLYQNKSQSWQSNIDTLKQDFEKAVNQYRFELTSLSTAERKTKEAALQQMQSNLMQYSSSIQENAKREDEKMTQGVLNQVNSFVQQYGKEHGYTVILGTTLSGSLLYGEEEVDITKEVLEALNKNYNPATIQNLLSENNQEAKK